MTRRFEDLSQAIPPQFRGRNTKLTTTLDRLVEYDTSTSRRFVYDGREVAAEVSTTQPPGSTRVPHSYQA